MNPLRRGLIERIVLELLDDGSGLLTPEHTLFIQVNQLARPAVTQTELGDVLARLEGRKLVVRLNGEEGVKTRITDEGRAERLSRQ